MRFVLVSRSKMASKFGETLIDFGELLEHFCKHWVPIPGLRRYESSRHPAARGDGSLTIQI